jgi:hypothetical protein
VRITEIPIRELQTKSNSKYSRDGRGQKLKRTWQWMRKGDMLTDYKGVLNS